MLPIVILPSFLLLVDGRQQTRELPDFLIPCSDDPNLVKCPAQLLEHLRHRLVQGIPELGIPPIDPLLLPQLSLSQLGSTISDFSTEINEMSWSGAGDFKVLETFANIDALVFRIRLGFPYLQVSAEATAKGTILSFDLRGAGNFTSKFTNVVLDIVLNGERYEQEGREFVTWRKEDIEINYDEYNFLHLHGFLRDPSMTHLLKAALNKGSRLIGGAVKRFVVNTFASFIIESINRVHSLYSIDELYPRS